MGAARIGPPLAVLPAVQAVVKALDSTAVVDAVTTMDSVVGRAMAPWRLSTWMFALFASVVFGLAVIGLVSVVALDVAHRRHESAIRLALGASDTAVLRSALAPTAWRVGLGIAGGSCVTVAATRTMRTLLFGVAPLDAVTYVAVIAVVTLATGIAAYIPGRRAASADVGSLLRNF
jgi:ABC-type antimicrobial peptide transport system permease subunit